MLKIKINRISPTHHRFEYIREDGSGETKNLETKSFLWHDFLHYCLESEAQLTGGFFGSLARGQAYEQSSETTSSHDSNEILIVERVVGPLGSVVEGKEGAKEYMEAMQNLFSAYGESLPRWLTEELIEKVKERYRKLKGEWLSISFGGTLELDFEP